MNIANLCLQRLKDNCMHKENYNNPFYCIKNKLSYRTRKRICTILADKADNDIIIVKFNNEVLVKEITQTQSFQLTPFQKMAYVIDIN